MPDKMSEDNWVRFTTHTLKLCTKHLSDDGQVHERCVVCENARLKARLEEFEGYHARDFVEIQSLKAEVERQKALIVECIRMPMGFEWPQKYIELADPPQPKKPTYEELQAEVERLKHRGCSQQDSEYSCRDECGPDCEWFIPPKPSEVSK